MGRIFVKMFWDRGSRENSINNPFWEKGISRIGWLPFPLPPPPSSCKPFLSKQLTIFKLQKQVNILSLREHDSFFGKSPLRPWILDYIPVWGRFTSSSSKGKVVIWLDTYIIVQPFKAAARLQLHSDYCIQNSREGLGVKSCNLCLFIL